MQDRGVRLHRWRFRWPVAPSPPWGQALSQKCVEHTVIHYAIRQPAATISDHPLAVSPPRPLAVSAIVPGSVTKVCRTHGDPLRHPAAGGYDLGYPLAVSPPRPLAVSAI